jgi:hypothetical protein
MPYIEETWNKSNLENPIPKSQVFKHEIVKSFGVYPNRENKLCREGNLTGE